MREWSRYARWCSSLHFLALRRRALEILDFQAGGCLHQCAGDIGRQFEHEVPLRERRRGEVHQREIGRRRRDSRVNNVDDVTPRRPLGERATQGNVVGTQGDIVGGRADFLI